MVHTLEFFDEPLRFLAAAGPLLSERPVESTVVASVTGRLARDDATTSAPSDRWWVVVRDRDGSVVGAGMRTSPIAPHPPYLLEMPQEAVHLLARTLYERGEAVTAVNGFLPAIEWFARATVRLAGGKVCLAEELSLFVLGELTEPRPPPGHLRVARADEVDLVLGWFDAFSADASAQAGREDPHPAPIESRESTAARIAAGEVWLWDDPIGTPVHVTAFNPTSFGVARIGPVYTPAAYRGHGYAAAAVARISRRLLDEGARVCLFADIENQVSTGVYGRLGYRPVDRTGCLIID